MQSGTLLLQNYGGIPLAKIKGAYTGGRAPLKSALFIIKDYEENLKKYAEIITVSNSND